MRERKPALIFIFFTLFLDILGIGLIIPILPKLVEKLQGGDVAAAAHTVGILSALYAAMQFVFAPILGSLSDRYGRRPVILASLFGSGLDYILLAFAPTLSLFYVGRIVAGITGANITAASAYIADVSPPEKRAANFGIIGAAFGLGFIAGPALGGFLGSKDLRLPFLVAAGLTMANWLYGYFVLPESLAKENRRSFSWGRANPIGSLAALQRYPVVAGLACTFFLLNLAQFSLHATWVLYTGHRYGWNPGQVGWSLATVGIMAAVVQGGLTRRIIPAIGEKKALTIGLILGAFSMFGYGLATEGWMIYVILVIGSTGGIAGPASQGLISRNVADNEQGAVQGALTSLSSIAGIFGPLMGTAIFSIFVGTSTFSPTDFRAPEMFAAKIALKTGPVSAAIASIGSSESLLKLSSLATNRAEATALTEALTFRMNRTISGPLLHNEQRFQGIALRPETASLLGSDPAGQERLRLNRMLLEDAFPESIERLKDVGITPKVTLPYLPGASFLVGGLLTIIALVFALRTLAKHPSAAKPANVV